MFSGLYRVTVLVLVRSDSTRVHAPLATVDHTVYGMRVHAPLATVMLCTEAAEWTTHTSERGRMEGSASQNQKPASAGDDPGVRAHQEVQ